MTARPFRHLCPEADERDAMTDAEFWERVASNLVGPVDDIGSPDYDNGPPDLDAQMSVGVCDVCGSTGACGYDAEGRALIHADDQEATR